MSFKKVFSYLLLAVFSLVILPKELFHHHDDDHVEQTVDDDCDICQFTFSAFDDEAQCTHCSIPFQFVFEHTFGLIVPNYVVEQEYFFLRGPPSLV